MNNILTLTEVEKKRHFEITAKFDLTRKELINILQYEEIKVNNDYYEVPEDQILHLLINRESGIVELNLTLKVNM